MKKISLPRLCSVGQLKFMNVTKVTFMAYCKGYIVQVLPLWFLPAKSCIIKLLS